MPYLPLFTSRLWHDFNDTDRHNGTEKNDKAKVGKNASDA